MTDLIRTVIVFDAPDLAVESKFWAQILDARVVAEETWHSLIDATGNWIMGFQLNPNHIRPQWPNGSQQQQIHLDLHVQDTAAMHRQILESGGQLLADAKNASAPEGFRVYADPAGHPFCVGWGHPSDQQLREFVQQHFSQ